MEVYKAWQAKRKREEIALGMFHGDTRPCAMARDCEWAWTPTSEECLDVCPNSIPGAVANPSVCARRQYAIQI